MEEEKKVKSIYHITSRMHGVLDDIYEALCDDDESVALIDKLIVDLRNLKINVTKELI